jgi:hypothetical protein
VPATTHRFVCVCVCVYTCNVYGSQRIADTACLMHSECVCVCVCVCTRNVYGSQRIADTAYLIRVTDTPTLVNTGSFTLTAESPSPVVFLPRCSLHANTHAHTHTRAHTHALSLSLNLSLSLRSLSSLSSLSHTHARMHTAVGYRSTR